MNQHEIFFTAGWIIFFLNLSYKFYKENQRLLKENEFLQIKKWCLNGQTVHE